MMDSPSKSPESSPRGDGLPAQPSLRRAWLGLWIFTWKTRLAWRSAPGLLLTLLAIPLLTFFTLERMKRWADRADWREDTAQQLNEFRAAAVQAQIPLSSGLRSKLRGIMNEEQADIQPPPPPTSSPSSWSTDVADLEQLNAQAVAHQLEQARQCSRRIRERARPLLDARQFELFDQLQVRSLQRVAERLRRSGLDALRPFYRWLIDFYFMLALPLYCLASCGSMIRDDVQSDTLRFLLTRPVKRAGLFLGKYWCQVLWLQIMALAQALLLYAAGWARATPGCLSTLALFCGAQFLAVLAWSALSALLGVITRRYLLLGIVYGFVVEIGIGRIPTNINALALTRHLQGLLAHQPVLNQLYEWTPQNLWLSAGALLLAVVVFLIAGAALFTLREYHHATEMQR